MAMPYSSHAAATAVSCTEPPAWAMYLRARERGESGGASGGDESGGDESGGASSAYYCVSMVTIIKNN